MPAGCAPSTGGRGRSTPDVLLAGDAVVSEPDLAVPHPRMWERGFVLAPLHDVAPDLVDVPAGGWPGVSRVGDPPLVPRIARARMSSVYAPTLPEPGTSCRRGWHEVEQHAPDRFHRRATSSSPGYAANRRCSAC